MKWIVVGEEKGAIKLVSKSATPGLLPKGSYLTVETEKNKFILRVDESLQFEPYSPSPLIIDMDLTPLKQDQKCQNIIYAQRIRDIFEREDGLIDYIPSQSIARRSTQEEINLAIDCKKKGPEVLLATIHSSQNQFLSDNNRNPVKVTLPEEMFYHQILVCGKTGSGKTVASKYLAQYFAEEMNGAVLAINVKDTDFLKMDKETVTKSLQVQKEWEILQLKPHGINSFTVYFPANVDLSTAPGVTRELCKKITLDVNTIDPDALSGLIRGISDIGAQYLPNVFRYWREVVGSSESTFGDFVHYFSCAEQDGRRFKTMNSRGEETGEITLHSGTYANMQRNLTSAQEFFDNKDAETLDYEDILYPGKMSVINVACKSGVEFGSIILRHLLHRIVLAKSQNLSSTPALIIIDEVHQFYNTESSKDALGDIDTICRTGRSQKIGVLFSSQNAQDIPRGLSSVINTKILFKSDISSAKTNGISFSKEEIENLKQGFAVVSVHDLSQVKYTKFPLALCGVFESE